MSDREVPLAIDAARFRALGHRLVDKIAERLSAIPAGRVNPDESPSDTRAALGLGGPLPEHGADAGALLDEATDRLFAHSLLNGHPRFFGYITSSPAPIGMLADLLAAALNANVGAWMLAPAATEIESETVRWIAELVGFRGDCGGLLVSGGNMANIVSLVAARAAHASWKVRELGVGAGAPLRLYTSAETHTWVQKAADLTGLGTQSIRWIETDDSLRMSMPALRRRVAEDRAAGDLPFMVIGTAGSVSTGAVDPLGEIAAFCREERLWFHVDGAYGGFAAAAPGASPDLLALREADSVALDPHKWLYTPLEASCVLVRDAEQLRSAFSYQPPYYRLEQRAINYVEYGPQNSRAFRALKVWLALKQVGAAGYRKMIADDIRLSGELAAAVDRQSELERVTQALSITTFRYVPAELRSRVGEPQAEKHLDLLNRELLDRMQRSGEAFVSNAVVRGRYLLRACIVNFNTQRPDVEVVPEIAVRLGREIHRRLQAEAAR